MLRLIVNRIAISIPLLLIVSAISFLLQSLLPGDMANVIGGLDATPEDLEQIRENLGLNLPVYQQYWNWLVAAVQGNLGVSMANGESVTAVLATRMPVTLSLVIGATLLSLILGVILGLLSSWGPKKLGSVIDVLSIVGLAAPGFWIALVLVSIFSVSLGLLPPGGYVPFSESVGDWALFLILPVLAVSLHSLTSIAKQTREAMLDVSSRDFIRNLRANGIPERSIVFKHALRNAAIPITTITGLLFIGSLAGSITVEQVFGLPGLGTQAVIATLTQDIPLIQGTTLAFTLLVVIVNLVTDIAYGLINPKVRVS
jgi:peptide/nickel transport system permease protein